MPFKSDLDNTPIDMMDEMYGARPDAAWNSVISAQISVTTSASSLSTLLAAEETAVVDEDTGEAPDGVVLTFSGTIMPHLYMEIKADSVEFTATVSAGAVAITDDANGVLTGTNVTGSIDYVTGEWSLVFTGTAPDDASTLEVDYTWFFVLPDPCGAMWFFPASEIRATFSPDGVPTAAIGIPFSETTVLSGQANLIENAKFIASATVLVDIELML